MAEADQIFSGGAFQGDDDSLTTMGSITVSPFGVQFEAEAFTLSLPTQDLVIDLDETGERVFMSHPNYPGWTIYSLDLALIEHRCLQRFGLKKKLADLQYQAHGPSRHAVKVYATLGILALSLFSLWAFTDTILGVIVNTLPAEWETKVGRAAFEEMETEFEMTDEPELTNRVHLVTQRLKKGLPYDAPKFQFFVADSGMVNAFALPGGKVIVMRGLIEDATAEELAGVLAHEMAHVTERHGMRALAQMVGPMFITKYVFGGDSALSALIAGTAFIGGLQYSRDNEREADSEGWQILRRANIDPRGLTQFFKKMKREEGDDDDADHMLSTHPATAERIQRLEELWLKSEKKSGFEPLQAGPQPARSAPELKLKF